MCRFIVYSGPPVVLSQVVTDPGHGILQQSQKAHDARSPLNADGFGLSWYVPEITPFPAVYKEITPAWSNPNLKSIVKVTKSHLILAHVRAASTGHVVQTNCHPFSYRNLSFMHNGTVAYFNSIRRKMMAMVSDSAFHVIQGSTDSEVMFAMFITNFENSCNFKNGAVDQPYDKIEYCESDLASALATTLNQVHRLVLEHEFQLKSGGSNSDSASDDEERFSDGASLKYSDATSRLNLVVSDGTNVVASRYTTAALDTAHSLYLSHGTQYSCGTDGICSLTKNVTGCNQPLVALISSEPISSGFICDEVPVNHMVLVSKGGVKILNV